MTLYDPNDDRGGVYRWSRQFERKYDQERPNQRHSGGVSTTTRNGIMTVDTITEGNVTGVSTSL